MKENIIQQGGKKIKSINLFRHFPKSNITILLLLMLLVIFMLSLRFSAVSFIPHLNSDVAATNLVYPQVIEKNGLFFNGWIGSEDVIMSRPAIITVLVHLLTGNWIASAIFTVCVMKTITLLLIFILLRQLKFNYNSIFASLIFLLCVDFPVSEGNIINGGMGVDYSFLGVLILSLIILKNQLHYGDLNKYRRFHNLLYYFAVFLCGFFGFKLIAIAIIPILLIDIFEITNKTENEPDFIRLLKLCVSPFLTFSVTTIGFFSAKIYNYTTHEWGYKSIELSSFDNILEGLKTHTMFFIASLGLPINGLDPSSFLDVPEFAEFWLRTIMLVALFITVKHFLNTKTGVNNVIRNTTVYFSLMFAANFIFFVLFLYNYASLRQHYFVWFFIAVVLAFVVENFGKTNLFLRIFSTVCIGLLCLISLYNNNLKNYTSLANSNTTYQQIADYLVDKGYDGLYGTFWNSAVVSGCSNLKLSCGSFRAGGFIPYKWLVDSRAFEKEDGKWAILLTDDEIALLNQHGQQIDKDVIANAKLEKRIENAFLKEGVKNINIYEVGINPVR